MLRFSIRKFKDNPLMVDDQGTCIYAKVFVQGYLMTRLGHLMLAHYRREHGLEGKGEGEKLYKNCRKIRNSSASEDYHWMFASSVLSASGERRAVRLGPGPGRANPPLPSQQPPPDSVRCGRCGCRYFPAANNPLGRFSSATWELCRCGEEMMLKLRTSPNFRFWVKEFQGGRGFTPAIGNMEFPPPRGGQTSAYQRLLETLAATTPRCNNREETLTRLSPFGPRYQGPLSPAYESLQDAGDFRRPGRPGPPGPVVAPGCDVAACEHAALDNEEHEVPSVWGTDGAEEREAWVRSQRVLQEILAKVQTRRTMKTPLKMPDGQTSCPGQDLPHMRVVMEELRYGEDDAKELVDLMNHFNKKLFRPDAEDMSALPAKSRTRRRAWLRMGIAASRPLTAAEASAKGGVLAQSRAKFLCNSGTCREIENMAKDVASAFPITSFFPLTANRGKFLYNDGKCREIKNTTKDVASHVCKKHSPEGRTSAYQRFLENAPSAVHRWEGRPQLPADPVDLFPVTLEALPSLADPTGTPNNEIKGKLQPPESGSILSFPRKNRWSALRPETALRKLSSWSTVRVAPSPSSIPSVGSGPLDPSGQAGLDGEEGGKRAAGLPRQRPRRRRSRRRRDSGHEQTAQSYEGNSSRVTLANSEKPIETAGGGGAKEENAEAKAKKGKVESEAKRQWAMSRLPHLTLDYW
ncbi:hypothetical protein DL770_006792 [Monosporascus sp. CRB-9-2]|nr:hypothetical protein DL770_006792 [Monosporascus sp. CRB-9-2]